MLWNRHIDLKSRDLGTFFFQQFIFCVYMMISEWLEFLRQHNQNRESVIIFLLFFVRLSYFSSAGKCFCSNSLTLFLLLRFLSIGLLFHGVFMWHSQATSQLSWEPFIAFLAHRFLIVFIEFGFLVHFGVAHRARKVMYAPCFVQCREYCKQFKVYFNINITASMQTKLYPSNDVK